MRCAIRWACAGTIMLALAMAAGCSATGAAITGGQVAWNLADEASKLSVFVDGHEGKQNPLEKAWKGAKGTRYVVEERVNRSPTIRYTIKDPEKLGRISSVNVSIYQEFEGDFSHLAEYIVIARGNEPEAQMKPGVVYDLGNLPAGFMITDQRGKEHPKVELKPGMQYRLVLTVAADRSENILVEFKTK